MKNMLHKKRLALLIGGALSALAASQLAYADTPVEMGKLIVTSDPFGDRVADDLINSVTVITDEELARRQSTTLGETFIRKPRVSSVIPFEQGGMSNFNCSTNSFLIVECSPY